MLKADIKHYFDTVDHEILISIIKRAIRDDKVIWLVKQILESFKAESNGKGMPLGNYTSQFFANVYLNELDYYVKHKLKAKYYIRYVDDFIILHRSKKRLEYFKKEIDDYLSCLKIILHPDKSQILPLRNGITFLGYRIFYRHKLLRKRNLKSFQKKIFKKLLLFEEGKINKKELIESLQGWFGYSQWASTYKFRNKILEEIQIIDNKLSFKSNN